jgi:xanthine dehydrogenase accessory factor
MTNTTNNPSHLQHLLASWYPQKDDCSWVLGTVYKTEGPCYRKPGAMMLFNSIGQQFGLLSGGCLEANIQQRAAQVMSTKKSMTLCYDGADEDDISFQLGIGCGGVVHIILQAVLPENNYLDLAAVYENMCIRKQGYYWQTIENGTVAAASWKNVKDHQQELSDDGLSGSNKRACLIDMQSQNWLVSYLTPVPHILVIGGGVDARPLVEMAKVMGWMVTVWDSRPANARREYFPAADQIIRCPANIIQDQSEVQLVDAVIIMSHNIVMDAQALNSSQSLDLAYIGLLGPVHRRAEVIEKAGLTEDTLRTDVSGPAGINIEGELPEEIALSILTECHIALYKRRELDCAELGKT